jgi:hypothetical protein
VALVRDGHLLVGHPPIARRLDAHQHGAHGAARERELRLRHRDRKLPGARARRALPPGASHRRIVRRRDDAPGPQPRGLRDRSARSPSAQPRAQRHCRRLPPGEHQSRSRPCARWHGCTLRNGARCARRTLRTVHAAHAASTAHALACFAEERRHGQGPSAAQLGLELARSPRARCRVQHAR